MACKFSDKIVATAIDRQIFSPSALICSTLSWIRHSPKHWIMLHTTYKFFITLWKPLSCTFSRPLHANLYMHVHLMQNCITVQSSHTKWWLLLPPHGRTSRGLSSGASTFFRRQSILNRFRYNIQICVSQTFYQCSPCNRLSPFPLQPLMKDSNCNVRWRTTFSCFNASYYTSTPVLQE